MPGEYDASGPDAARLLPPSHPADSALILPADDGLPPMPDPVGLSYDTLWEAEDTHLIGWWMATSILSVVWLSINVVPPGFIQCALAGLMGGPGLGAGCQRFCNTCHPKAKERDASPGPEVKKFKDVVVGGYLSAGVTAFLLASCAALAIYIAATPCDAGLPCLDDHWLRSPRLGSCQCRTIFWTYDLPMSGAIFGAQLALCLMVARRARKAAKLEEDAAVLV